MNLYKRVDIGESYNFVGVHPIRWHEHPDQPSAAFVEVEFDELPEVISLRREVAELKARKGNGR